MGCLTSIIGLGLVGAFGFIAPEQWIIWAGWFLIFAGLAWPEEKK